MPISMDRFNKWANLQTYGHVSVQLTSYSTRLYTLCDSDNYKAWLSSTQGQTEKNHKVENCVVILYALKINISIPVLIRPHSTVEDRQLFQILEHTHINYIIYLTQTLPIRGYTGNLIYVSRQNE